MKATIFYIGDEGTATVVQGAAASNGFAFVASDNGEVLPSFDVLVVGPAGTDPVGLAQAILKKRPSSQVLFLVEKDRLAGFRQSLPFIPRMASAWTLDAEPTLEDLAQVLKSAAGTASKRASAATMRGRINEQLDKSTKASLARQSEETRLRQLVLSEGYLATLLAQAPDAFVAMTPDGTVTAWNRAAERLFGVPADRAIAQNIFQHLPDAVRGEVHALIALGRTGSAVTGRELKFAIKNQIKWLELSLAPIRAIDDEIVSLSITVHDISERKVVDQKLRHSEERYRTLTETLPQLVWTCRQDGFCDYFSRQWVEYTGVPEQEQLGLNWLDLVVHPDDRERTRAHWFGAVAGDHPYDIDYRIRGTDGSYRWFKTRGTPVRDESGEISQWFGTCTDIQENVEARQTLARDAQELERRVAEEVAKRAETENALRQAQKMEALGQLTGGVAHDFNNLLQVVSGNLQLLAKDIGGNEAAQRRVSNALAGVSRGAKLASQLLAFGRRTPLDPKVIDIGRVVSDMGDMLRRIIGETVAVEIVRGGGLWNTFVDPAQIENAILNLAINARDAIEGSGKLTIEFANASLDDAYARQHAEVRAGQYVMLAVSDTGSGMSREVLEQVFEPFFSTKPVGKGTGLGLSMVYGFVKQSGGHIKIYSEVGQGTTVRIYLPRSRQNEDILSDIKNGPVSGGSETILVAEDDEDVRLAVVEMLSDLGYRVLTSKDAASALTVIESGIPIDLLFTDVVMPGPLQSPELARKARQRMPDIAVLFTSGYTENAIVHEGRLDVGVDLLSKPYGRDDLARKIRHVLNNQQQRRLALAPARPLVGTETSHAPLTILLVEDDALIRMNLAENLQDLGHRVLEAESGEAALLELRRNDVSILITDLGLPGMSGAQLVMEAREITPEIGVIIASGQSATPNITGNGPVAVLLKPFTNEALIAAIAAVRG